MPGRARNTDSFNFSLNLIIDLNDRISRSRKADLDLIICLFKKVNLLQRDVAVAGKARGVGTWGI